MTSKHNPTKIVVTTDTHYWPDSQECFGQLGEQLQPWFETIHSTFLAEARSVSPDILVHLGDFSCGGGTFDMPDDAFFHTMERIVKDFQGVAPSFLALPGNHDCPAGTNDYTFCEELLGLSPCLGHTVDVGHARLIFLHSQGHTDEFRRAVRPKDPTSGWIADEELARLDQSLAEAAGRPVIVFTHQLLHPWANAQRWRKLFATTNSEAVLDIFARHGNVRAVFQGHAHILDMRAVRVGGQLIPFVVAPSLIQYPLGWLLLTLSPSSLRVQYRPLPLAELSERSRTAGSGSAWRTPDPAWHDFLIEL
ncbi:MAG: metallophosphoesterase [Caldilineaceae bacterium]